MYNHFNSHAPRGARRVEVQEVIKLLEISTHTPREGRDMRQKQALPYEMNFNSHAPRGARLDSVYAACRCFHFNSHAPRGARQNGYYTIPDDEKFQLTRPARGATLGRERCARGIRISTHTPREGRDRTPVLLFSFVVSISTHTPREGRDRTDITGAYDCDIISTHTPREGRDPRCRHT